MRIQAGDIGTLLLDRGGTPRPDPQRGGIIGVAGNAQLIGGDRAAQLRRYRLDIEQCHLKPDIGLRDRRAQQGTMCLRIGHRHARRPLAAQFDGDAQPDRDFGLIETIIGARSADIFQLGLDGGIGTQARDGTRGLRRRHAGLCGIGGGCAGAGRAQRLFEGEGYGGRSGCRCDIRLRLRHRDAACGGPKDRDDLVHGKLS